VVLVDLISPAMTPSTTSVTIRKTMRQVLKPSRTRFVLVPSHLH
jgi:hypothetical protein